MIEKVEEDTIKTDKLSSLRKINELVDAVNYWEKERIYTKASAYQEKVLDMANKIDEVNSMTSKEPSMSHPMTSKPTDLEIVLDFVERHNKKDEEKEVAEAAARLAKGE